MKNIFNKYKFIITTLLVLIIISSIGMLIDVKFNKRKASAVLVPKEDIIKEIIDNIEVKDVLEVEINSSLPDINDYFKNPEIIGNSDPEMNLNYIFEDQSITPDISVLGDYSVKITISGNEYSSILKVVDTTPPVVELKNIAIYENSNYSIENFIESYTDNSKNDTYRAYYVNESDANIKEVGTYYIKINFCDAYENCKEEIATLVINKKENKPVNNQNNNTSSNNKKPQNNNNSNNNNNNNNEQNTPSKVTKREILNTLNYNYGVKRITYQDVTYNNVDGKLIEESRSNNKSEITFYDFNGTIESMTPEAISIYEKTSNTRDIILSYTNKYRTEVGVAPLTVDRNISILANIKAIEMAYSDKFDHVRPDGSSWDTLHKNYYKLNGLPVPYKRGENLAMGYNDEAVACEVWKNSHDHYINIIDSEFTKIGIGKYTFNGKTYYVQIFSS